MGNVAFNRKAIGNFPLSKINVTKNTKTETEEICFTENNIQMAFHESQYDRDPIRAAGAVKRSRRVPF